jgi:protoporphyrinogen oxidase
LSLSDKFGLAKIVLKMTGITDPTQFDNITAEKWIINNSNRKVYEKFFKPLVLSKYRGYRNISASWFIERMKLRNQRGISGERLGYLRGGFEQMIQKMVKKIKDKGGEIRLSKTVSHAGIDGRKIKSLKIGSETVKVDSIISTINPNKLERIVAGFKSSNVKYQGSVCVLLALKKQLHPYYWTNIIKPELRFGAVIEHTNFMPVEDYDEHLVYLASYPEENSAIWKRSDVEVFESYLSDVKRLFQLDRKDISKWWVFRDKESGLVFETGTAIKMPPIRTGFENLFIGGVFNSYPERSSDESVRIGKECAKLAMGE